MVDLRKSVNLDCSDFRGGPRARRPKAWAGHKNIPPASVAGGIWTAKPPQGFAAEAVLPCGGGGGFAVTQAAIWN